MRELATRAGAWWNAPASPRQAYGLAAAIGLLVYLIVYGPGHLLGTSTYWDLPQEDSRAYLMAYRYFLHEPWHWPLLTSHTINLPATKAFALSDGVPIWALANKLVATVLPPWRAFSARAYLGLFHALSHVLQPCLGVAILRLFGRRSRGEAIVTAVFLLALPAWIFRYQHAALSAQFLILWPLYLYLRTPPGAPPPVRLQIGWLCELAVVAMTNPYHVVMSFGLFAAALVRSRRWRALAWLPAALAAIALAAGLAGYFARATATPMGGFEIYTTNVTSMFVPARSALLGDARTWFGDLAPINNQYEGTAYLGLGLVILFALFLPRARSLRGVIKRHPGLFAIALGAWCFALSTRVYFNSHLVLSYELPARLHFLEVWFRAPGRFVYVPMYVLIVFLLQWAFRRFTSGWQRFVLPALAIVQLVDASAQWRFQHDYTQGPYPHVLPMQPWRALVQAHATVLELPTFDCLSSDWTKLKPALEIAYYASERAIPINGVYGARPVRDCTEDARAFTTLTPADHTLYVWFTTRERFPRRLEKLGATCGAFDYGWACSNDGAAIGDAITAGALRPMTHTPVSPPVLAYGARIEPGLGGTPAYLTDGWSFAEQGGRWSDGPLASIELQLASEPPPHAVLRLQAAGVICGRRRAQDVDVAIDDVTVGTLHFDAGTNDVETVRSIPISDPALLRGALTLDFKPRDVRPPSTVRCNDDTRRTGVWLRRLWFEAAP